MGVNGETLEAAEAAAAAAAAAAEAEAEAEAEGVGGGGSPTQAPPVYFRSFTFSPDVLIRFDYHGKHVDMSRHGPLAGLLVGLAQLNCSQLTLKRLSHRHGSVFTELYRVFFLRVGRIGE